MDEPGSEAPASDGQVSFSFRQTIAVTTAVGAGFALFIIVSSPPVGSSGLSWAMLPAIALAGAIWFCCSGMSGRLATYAVVATLFAAVFYGLYWSQTDWLFSHTLGPPQLVVATCVASLIGAATGGLWLASRSAPQDAGASDPAPNEAKPAARGCFGAAVVVATTILSGLLALLSVSSLPSAMHRMDRYIRQRQLQASLRPGASSSGPTFPRETPEEEAKQVPLYKGMHSEDKAAQYQASRGILAYKKITDHETRLHAIQIIANSPHRHDGEIEQLISDGVITQAEAAKALGRALGTAPDDNCRKEVIHSLGRMGPDAAVAVTNLSRLLETPEGANVRSDVANALAAIGPSGKDKLYTVLHFRSAWRQKLLTVEQAQALYQIDPQEAEKLGIPRPESAPK